MRMGDDSACGLPVEDEGTYDRPMHIAAVGIIFAVSLLGSLLPVVSSYVSCLRKSRRAIELLNSFGFGVVIATAFIHMIPPALDTLNDPCLALPYNGFAMVIVLATVYIMQLLETELALRMGNNSPTTEEIPAILQSGKHSFGYVHSTSPETSGYHAHAHGHVVAIASNAALRQKITAVIFEVGVAIHSVIIGLELGVASGGTFTTLLIALCFHQFFEGVAVGTSAVSAFTSIKASVFTALGYSLTTPAGVVIGILVAGSYSETSVVSLWVRGSLDAVAGGILVYTGLVELMTYQYTINPEFHAKSLWGRSFNYTALYLGSAAMAVVGLYT
ncbi:Zinc (Zn2)-Iron (Fe2) Permease (ZIP) Family [Achlya hypogyna]|uniref:Zinc (Zn2)-Iron (Fe2) Permease (ZIP) Family n=1 Tax=Achlya hypogyna TaxID=1202772 RepID=A0A1V9YZF0_ACHHY|nr:Zinc (Zn2)-Iron (Fe2) Permease (ZIP) Family [Achlya hypogyna]